MIALLPYRQAFFQRAGWKNAPIPGSNAFGDFLTDQFGRQDVNMAQQKAQAQIKIMQGFDGFVSIWDSDYPVLLREIFDPPPVLFYRLYGDLMPPADTCYFSMVGTRKPHRMSREVIIELMEKSFAPESKYWSVSGFALGVDRLVHLESLKYGINTVAVLGSGLSGIGPRRNLDLIELARELKITLLFLTEYPHEIHATAWNFPRRNRIIAGMSDSLYCIQAPRKSGAMITARFAMDEGRNVYAFDHPLWKNIKGANEGARSLLEDGAMPILLASKNTPESYTQTNENRAVQMELWR